MSKSAAAAKLDTRDVTSPHYDTLAAKIARKEAVVAVIGLGYVGLPLILGFADAGFPVLGLDVDPDKITKLRAKQSYIKHITAESVASAMDKGKFTVESDLSHVSRADAVIICLPTPLTKHRDPDLSYVEATSRAIAEHLRPGQLVVLESTTYPGTTDDVVKVILEKTGLKSGTDFFIGFSPEREDPGNQHYNTATIPKVVAGDGPDALELMTDFYGAAVKTVVPV